MKKDNLLRCMAISFIAICILLLTPNLKAQDDILDSFSGSSVENCLTRGESFYSPVVISVGDTTTIIHNYAGRREISETSGMYEFCGPNNTYCSSLNAVGEFRIMFESPAGTHLRVHRVSFDITDNHPSGGFTLTVYKTGDDSVRYYNGNQNIEFYFNDCATLIDSIGISADSGEPPQLYVLDNLIIGHKAPDLRTATSPAICNGGSYDLSNVVIEDNNNTGATYTYHSGTPASVGNELLGILVSPTVNTTYYILGASTYGCVDELPVILTVNANPIANDLTKNPNVLEVCIDQELTVAISGASGGSGNVQDEYRYSTNNGSNWSSWSISVPSFSAVEGVNMIESRRTADGSGCSTSASKQVSWIVVAQPEANNLTKNPDVAEVCTGQTLTVTVLGAEGGTGTVSDEYRFSTNNGSTWSSWSTTIPSFAAVVGINLIESRRTADGSGCSNSSFKQVSWTTVAQLEANNLTKDPDVPEVCAGQILTVTVSGATGGTGNIEDEYRFSVNNGTSWTSWSTTIPSFGAIEGVNLIESRRTADGTGCSTSSTKQVSWNIVAQPVANDLLKNPDVTEICSGQTLTVTASGAIGGTGNIADEYRYSTNNGSTWTSWSTTIPSFDAVTGTNLIESRRSADGPNCSTLQSKQVSWTVIDCPPEVVCVMDLSGSMKRDFSGTYDSAEEFWRISYAKSALEAFAELTYSIFENDVNYGLASFRDFPTGSNRAFRDYGMEFINSINYTNFIYPIIDALNVGGGTPLLAGLDTAMNMFKTPNMNEKKAIILLSDGAHNCPPLLNITENSVYTSLIDQINNKNIKVYTIAFGKSGEVDHDLLSNIATNTSGDFYDVTNNADPDIKLALDPSTIAGDVWDAKTALDIAYSHIFNDALNLNFSADPMGIISKGSTQQFDITVSGHENKLCFFISWVKHQSQYLKVKIQNSNGIELPSNHSNVKYIHSDNYTIVSVSGNYLNLPGVIGSNPWKLELDASDIDGSEKFQYMVLNQSNRLKFNAWFDKKWYYTGDIMKIYLDVKLDSKRITKMEKPNISGSKPKEGLGNWLNRGNVNKSRLEEERKYHLNEIKKIVEENVTKLKVRDDEKQMIIADRIKTMDDAMSSVWLKTHVLIKDKIEKYPERLKIDGLQFNDEGRHGDEKAGDGIFTAVFNGLNKEGTYKFNVGALNSGKENIKLEDQLTKYVRVKIIPKKFITEYIQLDTLIRGKTVYNIKLNLRDEFGNVPHPNSLRNIKLNLNKGELIGNIQANLDGTFTQTVVLTENIKPRQVKLAINVYEHKGEQRLESVIPDWKYIALGFILLVILIGIIRRKK